MQKFIVRMAFAILLALCAGLPARATSGPDDRVPMNAGVRQHSLIWRMCEDLILTEQTTKSVWHCTDELLAHNNLTWESARHLRQGYVIRIPLHLDATNIAIGMKQLDNQLGKLERAVDTQTTKIRELVERIAAVEQSEARVRETLATTQEDHARALVRASAAEKKVDDLTLQLAQRDEILKNRDAQLAESDQRIRFLKIYLWVALFVLVSSLVALSFLYTALRRRQIADEVAPPPKPPSRNMREALKDLDERDAEIRKLKALLAEHGIPIPSDHGLEAPVVLPATECHDPSPATNGAQNGRSTFRGLSGDRRGAGRLGPDS